MPSGRFSSEDGARYGGGTDVSIIEQRGRPMIYLGELVPAKSWNCSWPHRSVSGPFEPYCGLSSAPNNAFAGFMSESDWRAVRKYLEDAEALLQQAIALDLQLASDYQSPTYMAGIGAANYALAHLRARRNVLPEYFARREMREIDAQLLQVEADRVKAGAVDPQLPLTLKVYVPGSLRVDYESEFLLHVPDFYADMIFDTMYEGWFYMSLLESTDKCLRTARAALEQGPDGNERETLVAAIDHRLAG